LRQNCQNCTNPPIQNGKYVNNVLARILQAARRVRTIGRPRDETDPWGVAALTRDGGEFARFGPAFDRAALGLSLVAHNGTVLTVNDQLCAITGYSREELCEPGKFLAITHPDDQEADIARRKAMLAGDIDRFTITKRYLRKDGQIVWVNYSGSALLNAGRPERYMGIIEDITERKRIETALAESEERLRLALGAAGMGVRELDLVTGKAVSTPEAEKIFGRDDDRDTSFERWFANVHPDDQASVRANWNRALANPGTDIAHEYRFRRPDGTWRWIFSHGRLEFKDGRPSRTTGVIQDITQRKEIEIALRGLTETLEARVREEITGRETAQTRAAQAERLQALGQLAGGIAHDFNNVLQAVMGALRLIERHPGDQDGIHRLAQLAGGAVERGISITRRLLTLGQRGDLTAETLDVSEVLHELREILTHTLGATIEVRLRLQPGLRPMLADRGQLETVLVNLATNARDAMPKGGELMLSAEHETVTSGPARHSAGLAPGRYIRLRVADGGEGMDTATLARAREPFFTTKRSGSGTGLGLAMAQGFAEQSGGALAIESKPGSGTTVTLWLPEAVSETVPDTVARPTGPASPAGAQVRILLVDDEAMIREILARQLSEAGFDVLVASSGAEALELSARETVDAVVTDLSMSGVDGLAVIRGMQARSPGLPAVLLTGYAGDETALALSGAMSGTFSLLRKPVSEVQLLDRLRALLASRPGVR
jgi:PAS domain S-box-containing protein